ncbi:fasciclin-like arabinogalactan protein 2 [Brachypodium distachyon]|uniref:FAS1 domain-containing protein n=1 Tax=Brachypodium distachyon TaxID=15368 RepID=I1IRI7_BRADI|nr:fasciclin-like arabinogalactan protein 2 [Brachypodium distachyon]KQJ90894.1 hypothetical protein BRADI_4g34420v3 [Brachypodium distachyon]PNT64883.1 hypothetical protein BRADI_4g34420v3 [Brachypodium distachyon]|eukprot:XP_003576707.1 fasciclin-like arabinogalactan protein 2 [Brachypodium distachyon]
MDARRRLCLVAAVLLAAAAAAEGYNITKILGEHPEYSQFNKLLTQTRLAADINKRRTITVLVVANGDMGALAAGRTLQTIRHILQMHVLVDYYGAKKLHQLAHGVTASSSMFQESGAAPGMSGYVNITQHRGGHVTFTAEDASDSASPVSFVKSVKEIPYDLSVLQISKVLSSPEAEAPVAAPAPVNITELLSKKYCKSFAGLLAADADAFSTVNATKDNGLTLFCPVDAAVASFMPKYKNLTAKAKTAILLYHAVPDYYSLQLLTSNSGKVSTLATSSVAKKDYSFDVSKDGETAALDTKVITASVTATVKDDDPLAVYAVSKFLQPKELFKVAKDLAPAPAPEGPKKKSSKKKPSAASSPSDDDDDSAADSPDDDSGSDVDAADKAGAAPPMLARWVTAAAATVAALALAT